MRRLLALYNTTLARHPIATQATTSSILWGLGDCVAQKGAEARSELDTRRTGLTAAFGGWCVVGAPSRGAWRLLPVACTHHGGARASTVNRSFMGPVGHHWYEYLDKAVAARVPPQAGASGRLRFILTKVAADTAVLGPLYVVAFFLFGAVAIDGSGWAGFTSKLQQDFVPTFVAQLAVWPAFQVRLRLDASAGRRSSLWHPRSIPQVSAVRAVASLADAKLCKGAGAAPASGRQHHDAAGRVLPQLGAQPGGLVSLLWECTAAGSLREPAGERLQPSQSETLTHARACRVEHVRRKLLSSPAGRPPPT